ncbi:NAD(P)-dependent oxidoreductase [Bailinhaonella thermotolerans]|uniref:NAD(P)-dependent oxidoreductase n=1 Tax=Bailinhaonella thermotolerans TaxID=1070861 RepID=A0A3A4A9T5_9ACTN|nr:NAD(P)-binding domain-containing protein [Bailinhaonella thermotolerans]RJL23094.1 NAD(P)-dependent oxidoreductase [Bailinhaonella thermotolerans]
MNAYDRTPVTVLGLGSMGAAVAGAFLDAGHPTTVWNRTAAKAAPLVERGAIQAATVAEAVAASPLTISVLTTFEDTRAALEPAGAALAGRALVTLNSGAPEGARRTAEWAAGHGARFLAGAIKNVPAAVGAPDTLLYYGGDKGVFADHEATLRVLGGDTVHLGEEPDLAALYEMSVGATLLPALVGFFHGAAGLRARGLEARSMVRFSVKWLEMIASILPVLAEQIDAGDHGDAFSSVNLFLAGADEEREFSRELGLDDAWMAPLHDLLRRAAEAGYGEHNISALTEVIKPKAA